MNRGSTVDSVASVYAKFRRETEVVFYCNWMVGFPGETEQDFQRTVELAKMLDLQISVAIPFSSRPGTPAEQFGDQIDDATKTGRVSRLTEVIAEIKAAQFDKHLSFLDDARRQPLLELIRKAEARLYAESNAGLRPVIFHRHPSTMS
jgi:tRNA A37 methylthiotransferase MiaB